MSKTKKIVITIITICVFLTIVGWIFVPRLFVWFAARQITPDIGPGAEYFTEYDISLTDMDLVQTTSPGGLSMDIPNDYAEKEISLENTLMYVRTDETNIVTDSIVFMAASDLNDMNLFSEENIAELTDGPLSMLSTTHLIKGFEALGHGLPDSAYGTFKSSALLTEDDYSFWRLNQGFAYVVSGMIKNSSMMGEYNYIYETEEICGIIHVMIPSDREYKYYIVADMFATDDLGTAHGLLIKTNSLEEAYGMINSIVIK